MSPTIGEVREKLLADIRRWRPELELHPRSTLWYGVATKASNHLDQLLELCVDDTIQRAGSAATEPVQKIAGGKPLERLTMGERMSVLVSLDSQRLIKRGARLIHTPDKKLLEEAVLIRKGVAHGLIPPEEGPLQTMRLLDLSELICGMAVLDYLQDEDV